MKKESMLPAKLPTMEQLITQSESSLKQNALMVLLNQEPPKQWIKQHPMSKKDYLPIERVEYLLTRIFGKWWVEVLETKTLANSCAVTIRLFVTNPITGEVEHNDGVGAAPMQTNSGAGAMDWNQIKSDAVTKALPTAETNAIKDAADKFGKLFGKDLNRKDEISYDSLLKVGKNGITNDDETIKRIISDCKNEKELINFNDSLTPQQKEMYATELNAKLDSFLQPAA